MKQLLPLRPYEKDYKEFVKLYLKDRFTNLSQPLTTEELREIIYAQDAKYHHLFLGSFSSALEEDTFFDPNLDIMLIQHYRYMPPTLHHHQFFELAYVATGSVYNYIGNQCIMLNAGDLLIVAPGSDHAVWADQDDAVLINILIRTTTFEQHFLNILPKHELLYNFFVQTLYHSSDTPYLLFKTRDDQVLSNQIYQLFQEYHHSKRYKETAIVAMTSLMLVTLLRNHETDVIIPSVNEASNNKNFMLILQYMQKHYTTITLSELARFFNYSERQVQRIITSATGLSFSENIKKMKMLKAAILLESTDMSIASIAETLGYYDASNFRQVFKSYYHVTPAQYRK